MMYAGIDYHKHYSFVSILDAEGQLVLERRIHHKEAELFRELLEALPEGVAVVYKSTFNWSWLYEILEKIPNLSSITLANPYKVRLIAEAQIKTDKISSRTLAILLRVGVVPACHIPDRKMRDRKEVLRQRAYWVRLRTAVRCRIHSLIGKQHDLAMPQVSDLLGRKGRGLRGASRGLRGSGLRGLRGSDLIVADNESATQGP